MKEHNYLKKLRKMIQKGQLAKGTQVTDVYIYHDDWCGIYKNRRCNCNPDIKLKHHRGDSND